MFKVLPRLLVNNSSCRLYRNESGWTPLTTLDRKQCADVVPREALAHSDVTTSTRLYRLRPVQRYVTAKLRCQPGSPDLIIHSVDLSVFRWYCSHRTTEACRLQLQ